MFFELSSLKHSFKVSYRFWSCFKSDQPQNFLLCRWTWAIFLKFQISPDTRKILWLFAQSSLNWKMLQIDFFRWNGDMCGSWKNHFEQILGKKSFEKVLLLHHFLGTLQHFSKLQNVHVEVIITLKYVIRLGVKVYLSSLAWGYFAEFFANFSWASSKVEEKKQWDSAQFLEEK